MEASGLITVLATFIISKVPIGGWIILKIGLQGKNNCLLCTSKCVCKSYNFVCQVTSNTGTIVAYGMVCHSCSYCVYGKENSGNENGRFASCFCLNNHLVP